MPLWPVRSYETKTSTLNLIAIPSHISTLVSIFAWQSPDLFSVPKLKMVNHFLLLCLRVPLIKGILSALKLSN